MIMNRSTISRNTSHSQGGEIWFDRIAGMPKSSVAVKAQA